MMKKNQTNSLFGWAETAAAGDRWG